MFLHIPDSSTDEDQVISNLNTSVDLLEGKFQSLTSKTLKRLQHEGVGIDFFYAEITSMKVTLKRIAGRYLQKCFRSSLTLEMLWGELNYFWDFFNYELFRHVVTVMFTKQDDPLLSSLAEYETEIRKFLSSTKICDFFKVWPFSTDEPQKKKIVELKSVLVRVDRKWEDCTLQDLKNHTSSFAQSFFLPPELFCLAGVSKSSISILWYTYPCVASAIEEQVTDKTISDFLSDYGFISITIDNLQIYPLTPIRKCSLLLQKMYKL